MDNNSLNIDLLKKVVDNCVYPTLKPVIDNNKNIELIRTLMKN